MDFAFSALVLDRAGEARQDATWIEGRFEERDARVLVLSSEGRILLAQPGRLLLDLPLALLRERFHLTQFSFLGRERGAALFALTLDAAALGDFNREFNAEDVDLRVAAAELPAQQAGVAAFARSLAHWQSRTRYCGSCGAATILCSGGHRALCSNAACAIEHFPRTDAAMIALVHDGNRCLLGRQASWPERRFSTLAGFLEPGETLEDCVRREVFEEVGVRIGACDYIGSQPWPFPASLMLGFMARAESFDIALGAEICEARWFTPEQLVEQWRSQQIKLSPRLSISRHLIERWYLQMTGTALA
jgi:NAD+ diphosphatase